MNAKYSKFSPRRVAAIAALALGVAVTAYAMPPRDGESCSPGAGMPEQHMSRGFKAMTQLHHNLKLDDKQEALWKEAENAQKDGMTGMRDRFRQHHDEIQALLDKPGADLRAVAKRMDEFKAEGQKLHEASRDRWLTVYDTLNAEQKEQARVFFKSKLDGMGHHDQRGRGRG